ncbi:Eco57I restriction-modification methylase domain-containing protein, partial [Ornithobacterium rhinotracheale]
DWDVQINYGIKTGYNDAFIISGSKKDEILANCKTEEERKKTAEIIRPILRGRDIKRYGYDFADLWLINTHNGIKEKGIKPINIDDYPAIKKHLDQYWSRLEKRADQGVTPYNLRNCAYMEDFYKQKIVWKRVGSKIRFSLDENNLFA